MAEFDSTLNCPVTVAVPVMIVNEPSVLKIISETLHSSFDCFRLDAKVLLIFHLPTPANTPSCKTLLICSSKVAVTDFVPSIATSISFVVAVEEPDQLLNTHPDSGVAVKRTISPELYSSSVFAVLVISCDTEP